MPPQNGTRTSGLCSRSALGSLLSHDAVRGCRDIPSRWGQSHVPASWLLQDLIYVHGPGGAELHLRPCMCGQQLQTYTDHTPQGPRQSYKWVRRGVKSPPESGDPFRPNQSNLRAARWPVKPHGPPRGPTPRVWDCLLTRGLYSPRHESPRMQSQGCPCLAPPFHAGEDVARATGCVYHCTAPCCPRTPRGKRGVGASRQPSGLGRASSLGRQVGLVAPIQLAP